MRTATDRTNRWRRSYAAILSVALLGGGAVRAADAPAGLDGATRINEATDTSQYLGNPYKAEAKGFNFSPPMGSRIAEKAQSKNLLEFLVDAKDWGGDVRRINLDAKLSLDDYATSVANDMKGKVSGLQVLQKKPVKVGDRDAVRLTLSMLGDASATTVTRGGRVPGPAERVSVLSQQLIVQMGPGQFFVLEMYSPQTDRDEAMRVFDAMAAAFEVYDPAALQKKHGEAVLLGKKWLESLAAEQMKPKLNNQVQIFRMISGKNDVGFVKFEESEASQIGRKGVQMVMHSKSFLDNGGMLQGDNMAFWAYSQNERGETLAHYSMWDNISKIDTNLVVKGVVEPQRKLAGGDWRAGRRIEGHVEPGANRAGGGGAAEVDRGQSDAPTAAADRGGNAAIPHQREPQRGCKTEVFCESGQCQQRRAEQRLKSADSRKCAGAIAQISRVFLDADRGSQKAVGDELLVF